MYVSTPLERENANFGSAEEVEDLFDHNLCHCLYHCDGVCTLEKFSQYGVKTMDNKAKGKVIRSLVCSEILFVPMRSDR